MIGLSVARWAKNAVPGVRRLTVALHQIIADARGRGCFAEDGNPLPNPCTIRPLRPDLLGVCADLEGLWIGARELIDGRLELRAFAIGIAGDRPTDAVELDCESGIAERLASDIEVTLAVLDRDLFWIAKKTRVAAS